MMPLNVLITAGSRRVPLILAFKRALQEAGCRGRVITTDVSALSPAVHVADRAYRVPMTTHHEYLGTLEDICREEGIGLLVPTTDDELGIISAAIDRFRGIGVTVASSSPATVAICHDKLLTCEYLRSKGIAAAPTWLPGKVPAEAAPPFFVKPRFGKGSGGAFAARTLDELNFFTSYVDDAVVQQFLNGPEFTIDMLCNHEGEPVSIVARERTVSGAGVTDQGCTVRDPRLLALAQQCAAALEFFGAVDVQCRMVDGVPTVFEINPRFSGGIPLTIAAGADFPHMLIELATGNRPAPCVGDFIDGLWMASYESSLFLGGGQLDALTARPERLLEVA